MKVSAGFNLAVAVAFLLPLTAVHAENDWLHDGTWWYADSAGQIVEGDQKDGMVFRRDGTVDLVYGNGKVWLNCGYTFRTEIQINLNCIVRGEARKVMLVVSEDRTRIANVEDVDDGFYRR